MLVRIDDIPRIFEANPSLKDGCVIDTNILFAASFPLDTYNEWAERFFTAMHTLGIPLYTNINVRSEFIELNRRALIPEGLADFHRDLASQIDSTLELRLRSIRTRKDQATAKNRTFKLSDSEIKEVRHLLSAYPHSSGLTGWELFCRDYFQPFIEDIWEDAVSELKIQFLGTRAIDTKVHFDRDLDWDDVMGIIGRFGIGSSDAMITNLFISSKFPMIVTADREVSDTVLSLIAKSSDRYVLSPN